jgi:hypothetical protein
MRRTKLARGGVAEDGCGVCVGAWCVLLGLVRAPRPGGGGGGGPRGGGRGGGGGVQQRQLLVPPTPLAAAPTSTDIYFCAHCTHQLLLRRPHTPRVLLRPVHACYCWTRRNDCCFAGCFDYSAPTPTMHPPHLLLLHPLHRLLLHPALHFGDCFTH